jgi:hypothetical protein
MEFYSLHPLLYQLRHPWHWLTYGQNATAFGILMATLINSFTAYVLVRTLRAVNRQAKAADRQAEAAEAQASAARKQTEVSEQQRIAAERGAKAAEEQAVAAKSSTAVSEAQRIATEQSAQAERAQSELIRHQILSMLRPVIVVARRPHPTAGGASQHYVENHGAGVALNLQVRFRGSTELGIAVDHNILGPGRNAILVFNVPTAKQQGIQVIYESQDERHFVTTVEASDIDSLRQSAFEIDTHGGWLAQPEIPQAR